eukprot:TRINITY_DN56919_c0_g1_i1.p1 TRINITY_DN56919_c0_g1~~TRINITY_DN56919_c0_g1_i1.p1  ORF type:complete len:192 (-),score=28.67 TRINITY_DN56919_c0_g1_i1:435-1010(-)
MPTLSRAGSLVAFQTPPSALKLEYWAAADGGLKSTYEREVSCGAAVGDQKKERVYLSSSRLPREVLSQEAIAVGTLKARSELPGASITLDPQINMMMRQIQESEGTRQKVVMDPEFIQDIKRKHKVDHITTVFTEPRRPMENLSTYANRHHVDPTGLQSEEVDRTFFFKKNSYTEYVEARARQAGLQGNKK